MDKPAFIAWARVRCPYCGGVLTRAPDQSLAAHEPVFDCGCCGRFSDFNRAFAERYSHNGPDRRSQPHGRRISDR